ncbi:MAG: VWA domain-containing protein [Candidatus Kapabacteria bacterium]|nr:VWA domain-containing protein [Candidatus Kapabacteria bacterium]
MENAWFAYFLLLVPFFILLYIYFRAKRKKLLADFGDSNLIEQLHPNVSPYKPVVKFSIALTALALVIIGIVNPQIGTRVEKVHREGVDVIIALDISNSMKAEDIKPNRLDQAKMAISRLIDKLMGDKIGIVIFAGDAFLQLPITTDYSAAKLFLNTIDCDAIGQQGTAIGKAIDLSVESYVKTEDGKRRALIVITDGENHEDDALGAAQQAAKKNIQISTIGMGSVEGAPIPVFQNGNKAGYMKDDQGNPVITKLDPMMLQQIAAAGNGRFIRFDPSGTELSQILDDLAKLDKTETESQLFTDYDDRFYYFFIAAVFLFITEFLLSERKNKYIASWNLFKGKQL